MLHLDQKIWGQFLTAVKQQNFVSNLFKNTFLNRLLMVLQDKHATGLDLAYAIRDVLACVQVTENLYGDLIVQDTRLNSTYCAQVGITWQISTGTFHLKSPVLEHYRDVYAKKTRRFIQSLKFDPMLKYSFKQSGLSYYNGVGQRQVIRTILSSPEDAVVFVQLPTGCGKTLAIHALSLFSKKDRLILVIVPTVGLGLEQGLRAQEILAQANLDHGGSYVWHSQLNLIEKHEICQRMLAGTQRILFCSPEVAVNALRPLLFELSEKKLLEAIFVDEAHLIGTWGAEFRPEFQLVSALVSSLKHYQRNMRLILMSATFAQFTWDLLKKLFKDIGPFFSVNGGFLRPEIQFNILKTFDKTEHEQQVLNCLQRLPRPVILYTVKLNEAEMWLRVLKDQGLGRVEVFHGGTPAEHRESLIQAWKGNQIDIMVATSAFGVGMDKSDVHSVLHAAVPENIDRFYQESGRAGRDGAACISWLIYYDKQLQVAESLSENRLISIEKGFERWMMMCNSHIVTNKNQMSVSISSLVHHLDIKSEYNQAWNIRTLLLMQRAGLIQLNYKPQQDIAQLSKEEKQQYKMEYQDRIYIKVLNDGHLNKNVWERIVAAQRLYERKEQREQFEQLLQWLKQPNSPLCKKLQKFYQLDGYLPEYSCGGCPGCTVEQRPIFTPTLGLHIQRNFQEDLIFPELTYVYYPEQSTGFTPEKSHAMYVQDFKKWITDLLIQRKIGAIRASTATLDALASLDNVPFWAGIEFNEPSLGVAELVLVFPNEIFPRLNYLQGSPVQIFVAPESMTDPEQSYRRWWESYPQSQSLNDFLYRMK